MANAGAVTWGDGTLGTSGGVTPANSDLGTTANSGSSMVFAYDSVNTRLLVGDPTGNRVSLFGYTPKIVLEQPLNVCLTNGEMRTIGARWARTPASPSP